MTERDSCPKLEYLLDVCASMLLRAKGPLLRFVSLAAFGLVSNHTYFWTSSLGKSGRRSPGLWHDESGSMPPPSPVRAWELNDAFIEGMALLQMYPIEAAGGVESILQTAAELAYKRELEKKASKADNTTLGARLANTMWRGFTNKVSSPIPSPEASDDEDTTIETTDTEAPHQPTSPKTSGLTASWSNTIWKGITNQSAMEAPPSPLSPASPSTPIMPIPASPRSPRSPQNEFLSPHTSTSSSSLWNYAEKLRDTDAAATLAKVSTNWRVKAIEAWSSRNAAKPPASASSATTAVTHLRSGSFSTEPHPRIEDPDRRSSLPGMDRSQIYSPPARPAYFRPPRDSMLPQPRRSPLSSPTSADNEMSPDEHDSSGPARTIRQSIASFAQFASPVPKPAPKSGPRPLLLSSSSLLTGSSTPSISRSHSRSPNPQAVGNHRRDWSDVRTGLSNKTSMSSISSTSEAPGRHLTTDTKGSDLESDTTESRKVRINRGSVSPMAPVFRGSRPTSERSSSGAATPGNGINRQRSWGRVDAPDSPVTLPSSPPPETPASSRFSGSVQVDGIESQRGSMVLSESNVRVLEAPAPSRKITRKKTPPPPASEDDTTDSSAAPVTAPSRSPRTRGKRYVNRPSNLTIHRHDSNASVTSGTRTPSPSSLQLPENPEDADIGMTPRAATFDSSNENENQSSSASPSSPRSPTVVRKLSGDGRARKLSSEGQPVRTRKISADGRVVRPKKISTDIKRQSRAEEGDDEGYDDLLSAYSESEGNAEAR